MSQSDRPSKLRSVQGIEEQTPATGKILSALEDVAEYRSHLLMKRKSPNGQVADYQRRMAHAAIMALYYELKPYRDTAPLADFWESAELWPVYADPHTNQSHQETHRSIDVGVLNGKLDVSINQQTEIIGDPDSWVKGIASLEHYDNLTQEENQNCPGLGRGREQRTVTAVLTVDQILRAAEVLDEAAVRLGFGVDLPDEQDHDPNPI